MFHWLLRSWLHNTARRKVYEAAAEAAQEELKRQNTVADADAPALPAPCDVGLVFALRQEVGGLEDRLSDVQTTWGAKLTARAGTLRGRHVVTIQSGAGRAAARAATEALIAAHHPAWVISAGFAGALQPELKRGDILMADRLADQQGHHLALDLNVDPQALAATPGVHVGRLLTVDAVVRSPAAKAELGRRHDALAVDMESMAAAEVCRERKTRLLAIRVISDAVDDELPKEIGALVRQRSTAGRLGAALGAVVRRPSSVKDMYQLKEDALVASDRLARFLEDVIVQLVPRTAEEE